MPRQKGCGTKQKASMARRPAPKARTGCDVCKIRRVKCDEGRPQCQRCIKFGVGDCGYLITTALASKVIQSANPYPKYQPLLPAPLYQPQAGLQFTDEMEYRCFRLFTSNNLASFDGAFSDAVWGRIIAQASENELFVRDCFIAIGALERAGYLHEDCSGSSGKPRERTGNPGYAFAFKIYGRALQTMRKALSDDQQNLRLALIACLLVFCFESYVGNQVNAIIHAQFGISLLRKWELQKVLSIPNIPAPAPYKIEDELVQAFARLDFQVLVLLDTREMDFHIEIKNETCTALEEMPSTFKTLDEARFWCELLMRWNYHFRAESSVVGKSQEIAMKDSPIKWEGAMDTPMGATIIHGPKEVPVALIPEYRAHVSRTQQWFSSFKALSRSLRSDRVKEFIGGIMLQVQATMSTVTLASVFFNNELGYDVFLPEFRDIVALTALTEPLRRSSYHFDWGFIPALFLVAAKCRERLLRRKAVRLLLTARIREGVFDSIFPGKMAEWLMELEEDGIPEAQEIPDHRRVRIRRTNLDLPMRRAQVQGTQLRCADDLEPEWKETVLLW